MIFYKVDLRSLIPDIAKRQQCSWTKIPTKCVPDPTENPTDLWEVPQTPAYIETQKCESLVTQENKFFMGDDRFVLNQGKNSV